MLRACRAFFLVTVVALVVLNYRYAARIEKPSDTTATLAGLAAFKNGSSSQKVLRDSAELDTSLPWISALQVPVSTLSTRNASLIELEDVPVSLIAVVTMQRSSSTFIAHNVLNGMDCHVSLGEILFNYSAQSQAAWRLERDFLRLKPEPWQNSPEQLAQLILRSARRRCREFLQERPRMQRVCSNHCWVNWKQFHGHLMNRTDRRIRDVHGQIWKILKPYDLSLVVLERSVQERWRSSWYATNTGDWEVMGDSEHKKRVATAKVPEIDPTFRKEHVDWYSYVRSFLSTNDGFRWRDYSFDQVTQNSENWTRQALADFISSSPHR